MDFEELYQLAKVSISAKKYNMYLKTGDCVCIVETKNGEIYKGYSQSFSNITICAEKAAIIEALNHGKNEITKIITVSKAGDVIPPCGECLNLISHLNDPTNIRIMISLYKVVKFSDLMPYDWKNVNTYNVGFSQDKNDEYNLKRFVAAQKDFYDDALCEILNGKKLTHWIGYIWPIHKNLAKNVKTEYYGINSIEEAKAYFDNKILGKRLIEITEALINVEVPIIEVLGENDSNKLKASMTLFYFTTQKSIFKDVLNKFFHGEYDFATIKILESYK